MLFYVNFTFYDGRPYQEFSNAGRVQQPFWFFRFIFSPGPVIAYKPGSVTGIVPGIVESLQDNVHIFRVAGNFPHGLIATEKHHIEPRDIVSVWNSIVSIVEEILGRVLTQFESLIQIGLLACHLVKISGSLNGCTRIVGVRVELSASFPQTVLKVSYQTL